MPKPQAEPKPLPAPVRQVLARVSTEIGATQKQHNFASLIASGLSQTEAYRRVYDTEQDKPWHNACMAAKNEKVSTMLNEARATLNVLNASRGQQWREKIDEKLWDIVESKQVAEKDRIAALKLAGSQVHVQAFSKAVDAGDAAAANLKDAIASFFSTTSAAGITVDASYEVLAQSQQTMQIVDSTAPSPWDWDGVAEGSD